MDLKSHQEYNRYIEEVRAQIKSREVQREVILELKHHIQDIAAEYRQNGLTENEAIVKAITRMGDAQTVGSELNRIHRPRLNWGIIGLTAFLAATGLFLTFFIQLDTNLVGETSMFSTRVILTILGFALVAILYFLDYRKLQAFSLPVFIGMVVILFFVILQRDSYLLSNRVSKNIIEISPLLLAISLAGLFRKWPWQQLRYYVLALAMLAVPLWMILLYPSTATGLAFAAVFFVMMYVSGARLWQVLLPVLAGGGAFSFLLFIVAPHPYSLHRLSGWYNPTIDPGGAGWLYLLLQSIRESAGLLGQGSSTEPLLLPMLDGELVLSYMIYRFGWLAALVIIIASFAIVFRLAVVGLKTKDTYGKTLVAGITTYLGIKFLWNILMNLGIVPLAGFSLPFTSHGRVDFLINMVLIGLALSIYRRRTLEGVPDRIAEP